MTKAMGKGFSAVAAAAAMVLLVATTAHAAITGVPRTTAGAVQLANAMAADPSIVAGSSFDAVPPAGEPHGVGDTALGGFPTNGTTYAVLTTGSAALADDANVAPDSGVGLGGGNVRGDSTYDVTVLTVELAVPAGANCLSFNFKFLSEEFPEYVGREYNDAFIAELDSSTWSANGSVITAPGNFAFDASGNAISVNSSGPTSMTAADAAGTTYDGATKTLSAAKTVTPGTHTLYLSIFDQGDDIYDSAVFVDNLMVGFVPNPSVNCAPGAQLSNFSMTLTPATGTNPTGTPHTVTATLTETGSSTAVGNAPVAFTVTGTHTTGGAATTNGAGSASFTYTGTIAGTDTITASYDADGDGVLEATASATKEWLHVNDPPVCTAATVTPSSLWPPNHRMHEVTVGGVTDPDGDPVTVTITGVTQDEPVNGLGDGDTAPDAQAGSSSNRVLLRAERAGGGDGRVYTIAFTASDGQGGACSGSVKVGVPHDRGKGAAVDSGATFNSFAS